MKANIEIRTMSIGTRRDGTPVTGMNKKGVKWTLWSISDQNSTKYSLFMSADKVPPFQLGSRYDIEFETEERDGFTNNRIILEQRRSSGSPNTQLLEIKEVLLRIEGILTVLENYISSGNEAPEVPFPDKPRKNNEVVETEDQSTLEMK